MEIIKTKSEMNEIIRDYKSDNLSIGLVPTMGYFHEGHAALFDKIQEYGDIIIASVFVNPTQFGPNEDYNKYPRDIGKDMEFADTYNVDYLFYPDVLEIYPTDFSTSIQVKNITDKFEGILRPGHFDGVALVVAKLFNIVKPNCAIFGQKDYQQTLVIKQMVKDLNIDIKIAVVPTVRLDNGLALSSRNIYLTEEEKDNATILYKAMETAKEAILNGERERKNINAIMHKKLLTVQNIRVDYANVALAGNLSEPDIFQSNDLVVLLIAVYIGKTRLIDNILVYIP
jgi:pantoate--beta-alanine ligase